MTHSHVFVASNGQAIDADAWKKWPTGGSSPMEPWRNQLRNLRGTMWEAFWGRYAVGGGLHLRFMEHRQDP